MLQEQILLPLLHLGSCSFLWAGGLQHAGFVGLGSPALCWVAVQVENHSAVSLQIFSRPRMRCSW